MRFYLTLFFLWISLSAFSVETNLLDIRFGSYNNKELILAKNKNANKTRFIFESDRKLVYVSKYEDNKYFIEISNCKKNPPSGKYKINNGLVSELVFNTINNNISIIIKFSGKYSKAKIFSVNNPNRVILDLYGIPKSNKIIEKINKKKTVEVPSNKKLEFRNSEKLYLNLNDVPIRNIIKFFSDSSKNDIIADSSVRGKSSLSIKNQTLQDAFELFLISENLKIIRKNKVFIVRKKQTELKNNSSKEIFIKYANPEDICKILNLTFSTNDFVADKLHKRILIPDNIDKNQVNILIKKYDKLTCKKFIFISGFMKKSDFKKMSFDNEENYAFLDSTKLSLIKNQNIISKKLYSSIKNKIDFSKNKFIISGIFFRNKISAKTGPTINIQYFLDSDIFTIFDIEWNILNKHSSNVSNEHLFIEVPKEKSILLWNKSITDKMKYDNWNSDKISFINYKKLIPVIAIKYENNQR